jgi:hypothetical protein
MTCNP